MASDSSELLVLSIQQESIHKYRYPLARATAHASRIFGESSGSVHTVLADGGLYEGCEEEGTLDRRRDPFGVGDWA